MNTRTALEDALSVGAIVVSLVGAVTLLAIVKVFRRTAAR
jgi:uncharacterized membrane protein YeaQ/YmgE (transglycosylase-associated protein family)